MPNLGSVVVTVPPTNGVFPLVLEWGINIVNLATVVTHSFGSANHKIEQRFLLGTGARKYLLRFQLSKPRVNALRSFWDARRGAYESFVLNLPRYNDPAASDAIVVRFSEETLTFDQFTSAMANVGVAVEEIPATVPAYVPTSTVIRFPSGGMDTALLSQVQELIPLVHIRPVGYPAIYLSNRACDVTLTEGVKYHHPRLLSVPTVSQSLNGETDTASISVGNADRVWREVATGCQFVDASVEILLYHVNTSTLLQLWKGRIDSYSGVSGDECSISCTDDFGDARSLYPIGKIGPSCRKNFNSGACPYSTEGSGGDVTKCDKSWDGANGCKAHGMDGYFGGHRANPQAVTLKTLSLWGLRSAFATPNSTLNNGIVGRPLKEVYTDANLPVECDVVSAREENEFLVALGIVGAGPLSGYAADGLQHRLDGQSPHGPLPLGLRRAYGRDPAGDNNPDPDSHKFSLGPTYTDVQAGGTAFIEIRRTDPKGWQLPRAAERTMTAMVSGGLGGFYWNDPGTRLFATTNTNPVWIAINMLLKSKGLYQSTAAAQLAAFDVNTAIGAAAICADVVNRVDGIVGTETQFRYRGVISDIRPFREWFMATLRNCLGYFRIDFGKITVGVRTNASSVTAFTTGNVIIDSVGEQSVVAGFNALTCQFNDAEYNYKPNSATLRDEDEIIRVGERASSMFLTGAFTKSQAGRICTTLLREELGGVTVAERRNARDYTWDTTVLALSSAAGQVAAFEPEGVPVGTKVRITRWELQSDLRIRLTGKVVTPSMYDLAIGPKPVDVSVDAVPTELVTDPVPANTRVIGANAFLVTVVEDGTTAQIQIQYDPPLPFGPFIGISVQIEAPDGSGNVVSAGDYEYDGNPVGIADARYGTANVFVPQPVATESWRVYIVPISRSVRKKLVLHPAVDATPNRVITVNAATVAGSAPPPGDVTIVSTSVAYYVSSVGERRVVLTVSYTAPLTGVFNGFNGVQMFSVTPTYDDVTPLDPTGATAVDRGWSVYSGIAGGSGQAVLDMPGPDRNEGWIIYLAAGSDGVLKDSPWPGTGTITVSPSGVLNVTSFTVSAPVYATGRRALIIPFSFTLPAGASWDVLDWDRVEIHIKTSSMGAGDKPLVGAVFDRGTGNPGDAVTSQLEIVDLPDTAESWTITAPSFKLNGDRHTSTPSTVVSVTAPTLTPATAGVTSFFASVVTTTNESGVQRFRFEGGWVNPVDPDFVGVEVSASWSSDPTKIHMLAIEKEGSASFRTDDWPIQDTSQSVTIRAQAVNVDGIRSTASTVALTVSPGGSGTLKGNRLATSTLGQGLQNDGAQLKVPDFGISASLIADLAITTGKLATAAVSTSKLAALAVDAAALATSAVTSTKIANAAVGSAAIANLAVGNAHIANLAVSTAQIQDLAVTDAKIGTLSANKILAGTISASVTMTSPTLTVSSGSVTVNIDASNFVKVTDASLSVNTRLTGSVIQVTESFGNIECDMSRYGIDAYNSSNIQVIALNSSSGYGYLQLNNSSGSAKIALSASSGDAIFEGYVKVGGHLRLANSVGAGSPGASATHKIPIYNEFGSFLNYMFLYP